MTKHFSKILVGFVVLASVCKAPSDAELAALARYAQLGLPAAEVHRPSHVPGPGQDMRDPLETFNMVGGGSSKLSSADVDIESESESEPEEEPEEMQLSSTIDGRWDSPEKTKRKFVKKDFIDIKVKLTGELKFKVYGNLKVIVEAIRAPKGLITDKNFQDLIDKKKKNQQAMIQKKILEQALNQALMQQFPQEKNLRSKRPRRSENRSGVTKRVKSPVAY